jgi:uncharacterized membrane protein (DUF373 family)
MASMLGTRAAQVYSIVERVIIIALLMVLIVVVLFATWIFVSMLADRLLVRFSGEPMVDASWTALLHQRMDFLREVFSGFLLLLIGIELMQTVVMYLQSHVLHVEVVLTVAIVAIARHTIELDVADANPLIFLGMGILLMALSLGYYFFRRASTMGSASDSGHRH